MKKRLFACLLTGIMVLSAVPVLSEENADAAADAEEAVQEVQDAVEEAIDSAEEAVEEEIDNAAEAVEEAIDNVAEAVEEESADAQDAAAEAAQEPADGSKGGSAQADAPSIVDAATETTTEEAKKAPEKGDNGTAPSAPKADAAASFKTTETEIKVESHGLKLDGRMVVPEDGNAKHPFVVLTHGFTADFHDMDHLAEALGKNGIASVRVSLAGSGDSEGLYENTTLTTQKEDILNVLAYVKGLDIADTDNLFLCGKSQGGLGSALAAVDCKDDINAICLWFPAFCIPDDFRAGRVMFTEFDLNDIPERVEIFPGYAVGKAMIEENLAMDPYALVKGFDKDVLIIHGDKDSIVNYSYSVTLNDTYAHSELVTIKDGDHGFEGQNEEDALARTVAFIKAHLKGQAAAAVKEAPAQTTTAKVTETTTEQTTEAAVQAATEAKKDEAATEGATEAGDEDGTETDAQVSEEDGSEADEEDGSEAAAADDTETGAEDDAETDAEADAADAAESAEEAAEEGAEADA